MFAVLIHLPIYGDALNPDATRYMEMSRSVLLEGTLEIETSLAPRNPPLMAILFIPFALLFGFTEFAVHTLQMAVLILNLVVLYLLSLRVAGRFALVPVLFLALDPILYLNMSEGRALVVLIFFAMVTLWGIWKGLEDSRWMVVAAVGSGLSFLTADSVGYLVVFAGLVGLTWRLYYMRWALFRDRGYIVAIALFLAIVSSWSMFNLVRQGSLFTDPRVVGYVNLLLTDTSAHVVLVLVVGLGTYFLLYVIQAGLPFLIFKEGRHAFRGLFRVAIRDQRVGALVLFVGLAVGIAALLSAAFLLYEPLRSLAVLDTYLRYPAVVVPLTFLAIGMHLNANPSTRRTRKWVIPVLLATALLSAQFFPRVTQGSDNRAAFNTLQSELEGRGYDMVYSDVAIFLRYNVPSITFVSVDRGFDTRNVVLTAGDVPLGAPLLTRIYVPPLFDDQIGLFYLVDSFDPDVHSPLLNTFYHG